MPDTPISELKNKSLFARLKRLFSTDVIVRNIGGKKLKIIDTDEVQYSTDKSSLRDRFNRLRSTGYDAHSRDFKLAYQSSRIELFRDFDTMASDPILASALDIYADECTSKNEIGEVLSIRSTDDDIKSILENLFYDILNIEFNLWSWTRSLAKYGDFYLKLHISPEYGVYLVEPISSYYVTRLENFNIENKNDVKFEINLPEGNGQTDTLENYQVAHFRLLQDSNFIPYGTSMLEGARRIWKQLCLHENTRIWTPNGFKYIKDIKSGDEVYSFDYNTGELIQTVVNDCKFMGKQDTYKIKTLHRSIITTDKHGMLVCDKNGEFLYKATKDIEIGKDRLVLPNKNKLSELNEKSIKLDESLYSVKLNSKLDYDSINIISKIRSLQLDTSIKNTHSFLKGNKKIKWNDFKKLKHEFNITNYDKFIIKSKHKSICDDTFTFKIDSKFVKFFGFMLGDGWLTKNGIGFCLGKNRHLSDKYLHYIKELKLSYFITGPKNNEVVNVSSKEMKLIFEKLGFISGFSNKRVPSWIFSMSSTNKINFITGLFDADGSYSDGRLGLSNYELLESIKVLCEQSGVSIGHFKDKSETNTAETTEILEDGSTIVRQPTYRLYINLKNENNIESDYILENITSISLYEKESNTWDLEVNHDLHNFVAEGVVSHNTLMEDAMLIHRIMRAPEKRVFKIDIGNIPPNEVDNYMQQIMNKMKKVPYIDDDTGDYNLRFNLQNMVEDFYLPVRGSDSGTAIEPLSGLEWTGTEDIEYLRNKLMAALKIPKAFLGYEEGLCISPDTEIPLLNGKTTTVKSIINDYENGIKHYVYSIDENTHNIVPGEIEWAGYTRMNTQVVRVHLDNEKYIDCTPDHLFMTRDGKWIEAQNLKENQPLMPFYVKESDDKYIKGYTQIYNPSDGKYKFVHRIVADYYNLKNKNKVCHHMDFDKLNNYPDNLDFSMNFKEHREFHSKLSYKTINSPKNIQKRISDPKWLKSASVAGKKGGLKSGKLLGEWVKTNGPTNKGIRRGTFKLCPICNTQFYEIPSVTKETCSTKCATDFFEKYNTKYKVLKDDLIVAAQKSNSFKDLEKNLGNIDRNTLNRIFEYNNIECKKQFVYEYMPLALNNKGFMNNINSHKINYKNHVVVKVEFLNQKIDTCDLTIKNHHNFATSAGVIIHNSGKATLAAEDIRFARTIQRVQRIIVSELNKIAVIHLYSQGYRDESLVNFELELTNPSTIFEKEKLEIWKTKVELTNDMQESKLFSKKWIYDTIFNMSDKDMIELQKQLVDDSKSKFRFNKIEEEGNDPAIAYLQNKEGDSGADSPDGMDLPPEGPDTNEPPTDEPTSDSGDDTGSPQLPLKEKKLKTKKRDQTGRKNARDYPFGEDPLGTLENNRASDLTPTYKYRNGPLSLEAYSNVIDAIDNSLLLTETKNSKVNVQNKQTSSYMDENNIK